ncbi:hypothetical protein F0U61_15195 [Archangium violaceum]|uniref:hypothetical protein n=1 Tax=Archangium violaceum TaxID=83451 RepID=UPI002B28BAE5|nr:hypothetical protein F0U61_15195 [Archangium violaceum]
MAKITGCGAGKLYSHSRQYWLAKDMLNSFIGKLFKHERGGGLLSARTLILYTCGVALLQFALRRIHQGLRRR